jgi:hypothetical protein
LNITIYCDFHGLAVLPGFAAGLCMRGVSAGHLSPPLSDLLSDLPKKIVVFILRG